MLHNLVVPATYTDRDFFIAATLATNLARLRKPVTRFNCVAVTERLFRACVHGGPGYSARDSQYVHDWLDLAVKLPCLVYTYGYDLVSLTTAVRLALPGFARWRPSTVAIHLAAYRALDP